MPCADASSASSASTVPAGAAFTVAVTVFFSVSLTDSTGVCVRQPGTSGVVTAQAGRATARSRPPQSPP
ncbi:MAG: hypothetical protein ABW022_15180 [Actinoplanes sp.]